MTSVAALEARITELVVEAQAWAELANTAGENIEAFLNADLDDARTAAVEGLEAWWADWREHFEDEPDPPMCECGEPATVELDDGTTWCEECAP